MPPASHGKTSPLQQILTDHFDLPVFVENDINLAALGEWGYGAGRSSQSLVMISIGTGLGGGIIVDGTLFRGFNQAAGEVGFMLPGQKYLGKQYEDWGALESQASGTGIALRAQEKLKGKAGEKPIKNLTAEDVFQAMRDGKKWGRRSYRGDRRSAQHSHWKRHRAAGSGDYCSGRRSCPLLRHSVADDSSTIGRRHTPFLPRIVASQLGKHASVKGAIMLVLSGTTRYMVVKRVQS